MLDYPDRSPSLNRRIVPHRGKEGRHRKKDHRLSQNPSIYGCAQRVGYPGFRHREFTSVHRLIETRHHSANRSVTA